VFDFTAQKIVAGYTIPIVLDMLPGSPTVHIEHLGNQNKTLLAEQIAEATATASDARKIGAKSKRKTPAEVEKELAEKTAERREELAAHAVRNLDAKHVDGTPATTADIPAFVDALPEDIVDRLYAIANNADLFRRTEDPAAIAGK
jgi:hypothetical protein